MAYVTAMINQRLLLQCEYLIAENQILRSHLSGRLRLSDAERCTLAEIGKRLGRKWLAEVACVAKPETILAWYRRLIARKFDRSKHRSYPGRPRVGAELEALILRMARENKGWGYRSDRRRSRQSRPSCVGSNDRKRSESAWHPASTQTQPKHDLQGLYRRTHGRPCRNRLLHR